MAFLSQMWLKVTGINFAYLLILGLVVKALFFSLSYPDFLISIPIVAFESYKLYLKSKKPDPIIINAEIQKEMDAIKSKVNLLNMEKNVQTPQAKRYF